MLRRALFAALAVLALGCGRPKSEPATVFVDPRQKPWQEPATAEDVQRLASTIYEDASFDPKARYRIAARVLSRERYYLGWGGDLAPLDLALGWGELADPEVDENIDWYQGARWYFWKSSATSAFSNGDISLQSANVHVVPASKNLKRALLRLDAGDVVQLVGYLVNIRGVNGEHWRSSLVRTDTGGGSCELMYTTELIVRDRLYK